MKKQHLLRLVCAAIVVGACAAAAATEPPAVALRFVTATDAFTAIQQKLGATAAEAVSGVDEKTNTVALNSDHSQAAIVRAFLTGFDHRTPEVSVNATVTLTRRLEATASSPAREEVLSRRIVLPEVAPSEMLSIPGEKDQAKVVARILATLASSPLEFEDRAGALQLISSLDTSDYYDFGVILDAQKNEFASYSRSDRISETADFLATVTQSARSDNGETTIVGPGIRVDIVHVEGNGRSVGYVAVGKKRR